MLLLSVDTSSLFKLTQEGVHAPSFLLLLIQVNKQQMTETWNVFSATDIILGLLGAAGFLSMIVVIATAGKKVDTREQALRMAVQAKAAAEVVSEEEK